MGAIFDVEGPCLETAEIRLVNERRRVERRAPVAGETRMRELVQLAIQHREELVQRASFAASRGIEQRLELGNLAVEEAWHIRCTPGCPPDASGDQTAGAFHS